MRFLISSQLVELLELLMLFTIGPKCHHHKRSCIDAASAAGAENFGVLKDDCSQGGKYLQSK